MAKEKKKKNWKIRKRKMKKMKSEEARRKRKNFWELSPGLFGFRLQKCIFVYTYAHLCERLQ